MAKKKHCWWIVVLAIIGIIAGFIAYFGIHNGKIMNKTIDAGLNVLRQYYTVTEAQDNDYEEMTLYGILKFDVKRYDVEDLGNLCVMKTNIGLMQMATFVLTPYEKDMPMLSTDFMYVFGNRKGYVEIYDLTEDTGTAAYQAVLAELKAAIDNFDDLEDCEASSGWYDSLLTVDAYKSGKSAQDERFYRLFEESVEAYARASVALEPLDEAQMATKLDIIQVYCDTMVEKGGVSTSIFKKALGDDVTGDFFNRVFFGPANYAD